MNCLHYNTSFKQPSIGGVAGSSLYIVFFTVNPVILNQIIYRFVSAKIIIYKFLKLSFFRVLHHRSIYKYVHKVHHEWQAPIAISSAYAHPVEHIITAFGAVSAGAFVTKATIPVAWLW